MAQVLANEVFERVLKDRTLSTTVVMQAALTIHHGTVQRLGPEAQREVGLALASYAAGLIAAPARRLHAHAPHQFPTDLPTAIQ